MPQTRTPYVCKAVQFTSQIENCEEWLEGGMRARITAIETVDEEMTKIHIDASEFEAFNRPLESADYVDANGQARLTAREAGYYKPQLWVYGPPVDRIGELMTPLDVGPEIDALMQAYQQARDEPYAAFLERHLVAAMKLGFRLEP